MSESILRSAKDIGNRIKTLLELKQMTQQELSNLTGIRQSSISDYINGRYAPKADKIILIGKALNVNPDDIIYEYHEKDDNLYYHDPLVAEMADAVKNDPNYKVLFSATKDITPEQMLDTIKYIQFLKSKDGK